jgi:hypothetical protein
MAIEDDRLAGGEGLSRLLCCLQEILQSLGPLLPFREVVGENLELISQPVRVQFLDRQGDQAVQFPAPLHQERVVRHLVRQGVLEHIRQLGEEALLVDHLDRLELPQHLLRPSPDLCEPIQQAAGKLPADDRGQLQRPLRCLFQAVDPGHDHILDRVGNDDLVETLRQDIAVCDPPEGPNL